MPSPAKTLMFIHALTGLHPGSGTALGVVDMPVQRERHTQWPLIPGSSLKGILRDACRERIKGNYTNESPADPQQPPSPNDNPSRSARQQANEDDQALVAVFGPGRIEEGTDTHSGALSITDARLLAFPVRSLKGVFAWVTSAAVLERLNRDLALAGKENMSAIPQLHKEQVACAEGSPLLIDGNQVLLEEFEFTRADDVQGVQEVANWIATRAVADLATQNRLKTHLVVLHDDDFTHFVCHATEVVARVGLDYERKTVKQGALFYQEFLSAETLFDAVLLANDSRHRRHTMSADDVLTYLGTHIPPVLQIGGDETIGKGLCAMQFMPDITANGAKESAT